jgi:hypothetical protein
VLPGDDVLDLKRGDDVGFGDMAVLAAAGGPTADFLPGGLVHP